MMSSLPGLIFDGLAYGSLLFLMGVGLSITLGLMNVVNLAHGVFALFGGYLFIALLEGLGVGFIPALGGVFVVFLLIGGVTEWLFFRLLYRLPPLEQVLLTLGVSFIAMAVATYFWGATQRFVSLPPWLQGQWQWAGHSFGFFQIGLILLVLWVGLLFWLGLERTLWGARIRAAVDNQTVAQGLGIPVAALFRFYFALGAGLAGLGGALGTVVLGIEPSFVLKYLVFLLMVVVLGGAGSIRGPLLAAWLIGILDVSGKYFFPDLAVFVLYVAMVILLLCFPYGLLNRRR